MSIASPTLPKPLFLSQFAVYLQPNTMEAPTLFPDCICSNYTKVSEELAWWYIAQLPSLPIMPFHIITIDFRPIHGGIERILPLFYLFEELCLQIISALSASIGQTMTVGSSAFMKQHPILSIRRSFEVPVSIHAPACAVSEWIMCWGNFVLSQIHYHWQTFPRMTASQ